MSTRRPPDLAGVFNVLVLATAFAYLALLVAQAGRAVFNTDECFHAYAAEWIAAHGRLPRLFPELYSGFPYYYPPLLHLIGAVVVAASGPDGLKVLNIAFTAATLAALAWAMPASVPAAARRWAVLLCVVNGSLTLYALRFYAEALTTLLAVLAVALLLRLRERPTRLGAALLGIAAGLSVLAKQTGGAIEVVLLVAAIAYARRGERRLAGLLLASTVIGAAIAIPYFARNFALYGSPVFPLFAASVNERLYQLNVVHFKPPASKFYPQLLLTIGPWILAMTIAALAFALRPRRAAPESAPRRAIDLPAALMLCALAFVVMTPLLPFHDPRHLNPIVAILALTSSMVVYAAVAVRRRWMVVVDATLLLIALVFVARLPDARTPLNLPVSFQQAYREVRRVVPEDGVILSLWTYDTFYYTRRATTWPIPWGPSSALLEIVEARTPDSLMAALGRHRVDYVLTRTVGRGAVFDGASYSQPFVDAVASLVQSGRLPVAWSSREAVLVGPVPLLPGRPSPGPP